MTGQAARTLTMTTPDDWHVHLRSGAPLRDTVSWSAATFARAIVMPNLVPPVTDTAAAVRYREQIMGCTEDGADFTPLMTLYLTDNTTAQEIRRAHDSGIVQACKLYPAGATTNSDSGVTDIGRLDEALAAMAEVGMPLLLHGEVTDAAVDIFDREAVFLEQVLSGLLRRHPGLKIVLEHITSAAAAQFVTDGPANLAATITAHHLLVSRNAMLVGGIRPHLYCLPILKRERDRLALLAAATSESPKFFLGTDSAPHAIERKQSACGCAGCFTAHAAMALYAEAFDSVGKLDCLQGFASHHGADFYGLPRNTGTYELREQAVDVPEQLQFGDDKLRPFRGGQRLSWAGRRLR